MRKVFKVADIRDLEIKLSKEEISYSRMVEIMNEMAFEAYKEDYVSCINCLHNDTSSSICLRCNEDWSEFKANKEK